MNLLGLGLGLGLPEKAATPPVHSFSSLPVVGGRRHLCVVASHHYILVVV